MSAGTTIEHAQPATHTRLCTVHEDAATKSWFFPALADVIRADESGADKRDDVGVLESPRRVILQVVPPARIGLGGSKMQRAPLAWFEQTTAETDADSSARRHDEVRITESSTYVANAEDRA